VPEQPADAPRESAVRARADSPEPLPVLGLPAYAAEFLGTFLLVFFICSVLTVEQGGLGYADFAVIGLVHAFVLAMLIYTLGATSGGHFNPAVTTTLAALRKIAPADAGIYVVLQLAGGVVGAFVCKLILHDPGRAPVNYGAVSVSQSILKGRGGVALVAELIGTFVLMWAIMGLAVNPKGERAFAGLIIGATLGFAVMTIGPMTGAGLNPARALGPALASGHFGPAGTWLLAYIVGPLLGALLAGFIYKLIVLDGQRLEVDRPIDRLP
jgi:MIP family channel proteins